MKKKIQRRPSEVKDRVVAEVTVNSYKFMICSTTIPSASNSLKNLLVNAGSHSSYRNQEYNDKKEEMINIFTAYVAP